jgi:hypothetical protein
MRVCCEPRVGVSIHTFVLVKQNAPAKLASQLSKLSKLSKVAVSY